MTATIPEQDQALLDQINAEVEDAGEPIECAIVDAYRVGVASGKKAMAELLATQHAWDLQTFGPGPRTGSFLDHLLSELTEIEDQPFDVEEWIDVAILGLGGAMRHGATPAQVLAQYAAKVAKNQSRVWPDWRLFGPGERVEHIDQIDDTPIGATAA